MKSVNKIYIIDGCRSGCCMQLTKYKTEFLHVFNINELNIEDDVVVFIDMLLNLPKTINDIQELRCCGRYYRYHSSVFYAPVESWFNLNLKEINKICEESKKAKLSTQVILIFKIIEINSYKPKNKIILHEVHPELLIEYFIKNKYSKNKNWAKQRLNIINKKFKCDISLENIKQIKKELTQRGEKIELDDLIDVLFIAIN